MVSRVTGPAVKMSYCGWFSGEKYKDHFDAGEFILFARLLVEMRVTMVSCHAPVSAGIYVCVKCGNELFYSTKKFEHSSPWPAFTETVRPDSVSKYEESPSALKVSCAKCGNGLGHEFLNDGPKQGQSRF